MAERFKNMFRRGPVEVPLTRDQLDALPADEFDAQLEERRKRFANALVATETSAVLSSDKNLNTMRNEYILAESIALGRTLPAGSTPEDIAAAAYGRFQDFQTDDVQSAYEVKLDKPDSQNPLNM